jgi:hypothetical protein
MDGRAFLDGQIIKAGQMLGNIWYTAWLEAPEDQYLEAHLTERNATPSGKGKQSRGLPLFTILLTVEFEKTFICAVSFWIVIKTIFFKVTAKADRTFAGRSGYLSRSKWNWLR